MYSKFQKSNLEYDAVFGPQIDSDMTLSMKKYYQNKTFEPARSPSRRHSEIFPKNMDYTLKKKTTCYPKVTKMPKMTKPDFPEPFAFSSYELTNDSPSTTPKFRFKSQYNIASLMAQKRKIKRLDLTQPNPSKSNPVHLLNCYTPKTHPTNPNHPDNENMIKSTNLLGSTEKNIFDQSLTQTNLNNSEKLISCSKIADKKFDFDFYNSTHQFFGPGNKGVSRDDANGEYGSLRFRINGRVVGGLDAEEGPKQKCGVGSGRAQVGEGTVVLGDMGKAGYDAGVNKPVRVVGGWIGAGLSFKKSRAWGKDVGGGRDIEIIKENKEKGFDVVGRKKSLLDGYHMDVMVDGPFEGFGTMELNNVGSPGDSHFYVEEEG
jgi:hypothetical protein